MSTVHDVAAGPSLIDADLSADLAGASLALARRFHSGATLWVISPQWEPHAHHVAVEFVHPVVVGKRALPAVALVAADTVAETRIATRPGDVVIAVADAADNAVADVMRRAPAWGVETIWIGYGERPPPGASDHVLWVPTDDPMTPATGRFVLMYHLLWELTHVCFEHPGLLKAAEPECADDVCITCSDEGRLGEVVAPPADIMSGALVRTAEGEEYVDTMVIGDVVPGDLILIHGGAALTRLGEEFGS
ncbi:MULTISPECIES: hydrogenase assembly protein HupF [unclassified Nocardioides]|uniref:hydrogenase assembly protein HupF n=1 Tax=unclassified Nocardioides TaxID=2615069 RepID=UPI0006FFE13E|nr:MULTISPECIES: hydrogenase assembly protein HupF [unclassified Nocardioides]KRA27981.1 hydrogenase assembly protein HupF [Nocardioides sp. Root614]KRA85955.1 hydrogenase assembly protein HupF [Nocardioides sp. Root682]